MSPENTTMIGPTEEPFTPLDTDSMTYHLISPQQFAVVMKFVLALQMAIIAGGIVANILNILTFVRMGLKDCITITFFNLAISDLGLLLFMAFYAASTALVVVTLDHDYNYAPLFFGIDPFNSRVFFLILSDTFIASSVFISTFLNTQRSLCVILPLHFKGMFTKSRSVLILSLIWAYVLVAAAVQMSVIRLKHIWDSPHNRSKIVLAMHRSISYIYKWEEIVDQIILTAVCLVLLIAGVVIMSRTLVKSVRFRQTISKSGLDSSHKDSHGFDNEGSELGQTTVSQKGTSSKTSISNTKERQAIVQVVIISVFLLAAFVPAITRQLAVNIVPSLRQKNYLYFWRLYNQSQMALLAANASINFLVYFIYNTKFKQTLLRRNPQS